MKYKTLKERLDYNSALGGIELDGQQCWLWQGSKNKKGYGRINMRINGKHKTLGVHRVAFEVYIRVLVEGEEVDHLCYNRACINPAHLEAVSKSENLNRRRKS